MRDLIKTNSINDGTRTLFESILVNELVEVAKDWIENSPNKGVLIGGMALSYYVKPRSTSDLNIIFLNESDIPKDVLKFKRTRKHAFMHKKTHAEVEVLTPEFLKIDKKLVSEVIKTAEFHDGIKVASKEGLIATKLGRFHLQDQADIENLMTNFNITKLNGFTLNDKEKKNWEYMLEYINKRRK